MQFSKHFVLAVALVGVSGYAMAVPTLVGTTTNPTGINGLVVDGITYNVTFSTTTFNSPFTYGTPASINAATAMASALSDLGVTALGGGLPDGLYFVAVNNALGFNDGARCEAAPSGLCSGPWNGSLAMYFPNLGNPPGLDLYIVAANFTALIDNVSITPNTDPGGLKVGDSLTFTVSVDSVSPPPGSSFETLIFISRANGGDNTNFAGCVNLSGFSNSLSLSCPATSSAAVWQWDPNISTSATVSGNLFSFTALFDQPGTYKVFLESASAGFRNADNSLTFRDLTNVHHDDASAIVITVSESAEGLLQQLLEDVTDQVPGKAFKNKVTLAMTYYASNDIPATCAVLADFKKQVKAQIGKKKITALVGDKLMTDATAIMTEIGCFD